MWQCFAVLQIPLIVWLNWRQLDELICLDIQSTEMCCLKYVRKSKHFHWPSRKVLRTLDHTLRSYFNKHSSSFQSFNSLTHSTLLDPWDRNESCDCLPWSLAKRRDESQLKIIGKTKSRTEEGTSVPNGGKEGLTGRRESEFGPEFPVLSLSKGKSKCKALGTGINIV